LLTNKVNYNIEKEKPIFILLKIYKKMGITKLDWDSKFFRFPVGHLYIEKDLSDTSVINSNDFTFFQVRSELFIYLKRYLFIIYRM